MTDTEQQTTKIMEHELRISLTEQTVGQISGSLKEISDFLKQMQPEFFSYRRDLKDHDEQLKKLTTIQNDQKALLELLKNKVETQSIWLKIMAGSLVVVAAVSSQPILSSIIKVVIHAFTI